MIKFDAITIHQSKSYKSTNPQIIRGTNKPPPLPQAWTKPKTVQEQNCGTSISDS